MSYAKTFKNELLEEGYSCIEFKKEDYPVWSLWASDDTFYVKEIMYKDLANDDIYFFGSNYRYFFSIDRTSKYINSVLRVYLNDHEEIENAKELQSKIERGYIPTGRDILGNFVGAETPYDFEDDGELVETFECEDIVVYLEDKYNL